MKFVAVFAICAAVASAKPYYEFNPSFISVGPAVVNKHESISIEHGTLNAQDAEIFSIVQRFHVNGNSGTVKGPVIDIPSFSVFESNEPSPFILQAPKDIGKNVIAEHPEPEAEFEAIVLHGNAQRHN